MGIRTRVRGRSIAVVDSGDNHANEVSLSSESKESNSANTLAAEVEHNVNSHAQSVPINRLDSSNAINCSPVLKVSGVSRFLGRAGIELLDTLGSSMTNLSLSGDFSSGVAVKGNKISILAFEVAKTIHKGSRLMKSLSADNVCFLKMTVLSSKGVKTLISEDDDELLRIAAADKREELESFLREVIRFGNRCKDAQWRNLDRYFEKLCWELTPRKCLNAESAMQQLMTLVQNTAVLLSELCALDKVQKVCIKCTQEETNLSRVQRGDFANLLADIKNRRKLARTLKKKSLWSKSFEEVVEKLVGIVHFLLLKMNEAFGNADGYNPLVGSESNKKKLGPAGIALHYANIIAQIDTLGTLSSSAPPSLREALYQRLPRRITSALPVKLRSCQIDLECHQIKAEMDKTLQWLGPIARNTTKALKGFGWNGGLSNFSSEMNQEVAGQIDVLRIETLYHADQEKTEACILELVVWLHHLISRARNGGVASSSNPPNLWSSMLSVKDKEMLANVGDNIFRNGVSRSQNFAASKTKLSKMNRLTKSSREYPSSSETTKDPLVGWPFCDPIIDFDIDRTKTLDVIDGLRTS